MVAFQQNYDCKLGDQFWSMFADEVSSKTLTELVESIRKCTSERGLTNEQLGSEVWSALLEAKRFKDGED